MTPGEHSLFKQLTNEDSSLLSSKDFAMDWVSKAWESFQYFSKEIQDVEEIAGLACSQNTAALQWISPRLQNNRDFILKIARGDVSGETLNHLSIELSTDTEIVMTALAKNGLNLGAVSETMKDNPTVVLFAINKNPLAFMHASYRLRDDPEIALAAMEKAKGRTTISVFNYVGSALWNMCKGLNDEQKIAHLRAFTERNKLANKHLQNPTPPKIEAL